MSHRDQAAVDVGIILLFIRTVRTKNRKGDICIGRDIRLLDAASQSHRDSRPDSSRLKRITGERNEVGWRANVGRKEEQEKKEKREREGESKKRSTKEEIKEKRNIGKSERKRKKEEQEWHVKKVVPLLFSPFHAPTAAL